MSAANSPPPPSPDAEHYDPDTENKSHDLMEDYYEHPIFDTITSEEDSFGPPTPLEMHEPLSVLEQQAATAASSNPSDEDEPWFPAYDSALSEVWSPRYLEYLRLEERLDLLEGEIEEQEVVWRVERGDLVEEAVGLREEVRGLRRVVWGRG